MTSTEALLNELLAKEEIRTRLLEFGRGLDRRDPDLVTEVFLPGATDEHPPLGTWTREEMRERLASAFASLFRESQYFIGLPYIVVSGDTAKSETYVWCAKRTYDLDDAGYSYLRLSGMVYFDDWKYHARSWRIARRQFVPVWELYHSIGAEHPGIERHYKPLSPSGEKPDDPQLDYEEVARKFWGTHA